MLYLNCNCFNVACILDEFFCHQYLSCDCFRTRAAIPESQFIFTGPEYPIGCYYCLKDVESQFACWVYKSLSHVSDNRAHWVIQKGKRPGLKPSGTRYLELRIWMWTANLHVWSLAAQVFHLCTLMHRRSCQLLASEYNSGKKFFCSVGMDACGILLVYSKLWLHLCFV